MSSSGEEGGSHAYSASVARHRGRDRPSDLAATGKDVLEGPLHKNLIRGIRC
jgi:hypothetical protein